MRVLVTGGAGYIGSATVRMLVGDGRYDVVVYDDFSTGHREAIPPEVDVVSGSVDDADTMHGALAGADAVLHFAADIEAGESVTDPARFWHKNTVGTITLLDAMRERDVGKLVFSSTAAVYGNPPELPITEDAPLMPTNPYGRTKLASEMAIGDYGLAYEIDYVNLRYFNAAGADPSGEHGPDHKHKTHLITLCMEAALGAMPDLKIFGTDYDTRDGTAIRDYIHVNDLARAHLRALEALDRGVKEAVYNLGHEAGYTVREVVDLSKEISGIDYAVVETGRREGDPEELIASSELARAGLRWSTEHSALNQILEDAWRWHSSHPDGYASS